MVVWPNFFEQAVPILDPFLETNLSMRQSLSLMCGVSQSPPTSEVSLSETGARSLRWTLESSYFLIQYRVCVGNRKTLD